MSSAITVIVALAGWAAMSGAAPATDGVSEGLQWFTMAQLVACPVVLFWLWRADMIRPQSPGRHRARSIAQSPWLVWWGAGLIVILALTVATSAAMVALGVTSGTSEDSPKMVLSQLVGYLSAIVVAFWLLELLGGNVWSAKAGLSTRPRVIDLCRGFLLAIVLLPILQAVSLAAALGFEAATGRHAPELAHEGLKVIREDPASIRAISVMVFAVLLAPVVEEILFRVFVQSGFLVLTNRVWPSVLASSAMFAAVHIGVVGDAPHALVVLFALGVCLGLVYERTGRIWVPIALHAAFNAINTAATLLIATLPP